MDQVVVLLVLQRLQNLDGEATDQVLGHALEIVVLDKFVHIDREKLKRDDQMLSKYHIVFDSDHIVLIMWVMLVKIFYNLELHTGLVLELFLISNNFDSYILLGGMVEAFDCLSKTP